MDIYITISMQFFKIFQIIFAINEISIDYQRFLAIIRLLIGNNRSKP